MGAGSRSSKGAALSLSRDKVLRQALAFADREGLGGLSMRKLGRRLGAGTMSLYHHVRDKEDLLNGMVDLVFAEIYLPEKRSDWRRMMRARAISVRQALARHPWAIGLLDSPKSPGPAHLRHREAVAACLRRAGFSIRMAVHAQWLLDCYIYGFVLQEVSLPFKDAEAPAKLLQDLYLPRLPQERYPYLNEAAAQLAQGGYDPAQEFTYGLDLILDVLERGRLGKSSPDQGELPEFAGPLSGIV